MYSKRGWSYSSPRSASASRPAESSRRHWPSLLRLPKVPRLPWLLRLAALGPLPFAVLLVAGLSWYHFVFGGFNTHGVVLDDVTGQPIAGSRVWSTRASATSAAD